MRIEQSIEVVFVILCLSLWKRTQIHCFSKFVLLELDVIFYQDHHQSL